MFGSDPLTLDAPGKRRPGVLHASARFAYQQARKVVTTFDPGHCRGLSQMRRTGADSFTSGRNGSKRVATHVLR